MSLAISGPLKGRIAASPAYNEVIGLDNTLLYRLQEGTGTEIADSMGNGDDGAASGSGDYWANAGWWTPGGTDDIIIIAHSALLNSLLTMEGINGQQIIVAFDYYHDGGQTATEVQFCFGESHASWSGWYLQISSGGVPAIATRGLGGSAIKVSGAGGAISAMANRRVPILYDIRGVSDSTVDVTVYVDGEVHGTISAHDLLANGASAPPADLRENGVVLGARRIHTTGFDMHMNSAGSNGRLRDVLIHRRTTIKDTLGALLAAEINAHPPDWYRELAR